MQTSASDSRPSRSLSSLHCWKAAPIFTRVLPLAWSYPFFLMFYIWYFPLFQSVPLSVCGSLMLQKNQPLCPYQRKIKSHAWMTGGPMLWPPSSASVLISSSENTSALCCLLHWNLYNLHIAVTVPQTMLLPLPCTLLSPTWKIRTPTWGCCSWIIVRHLTP